MQTLNAKLFAVMILAATLVLAGFAVPSVFTEGTDSSSLNRPTFDIDGATQVDPYTPTTYTATFNGEPGTLDYRYDWVKTPSDVEDTPVGEYFGVTTNGEGSDFVLEVTATHKDTGETYFARIGVTVSSGEGTCVGPPTPYPCVDY